MSLYSESERRPDRRADKAFVVLCLTATGIAMLSLCVLLAKLLIDGLPSLTAEFLTDRKSVV